MQNHKVGTLWYVHFRVGSEHDEMSYLVSPDGMVSWMAREKKYREVCTVCKLPIYYYNLVLELCVSDMISNQSCIVNTIKLHFIVIYTHILIQTQYHITVLYCTQSLTKI